MQNVIVTGCSHGIGRAIAKILSKDYHVIGMDVCTPTHDYCADFFACDMSDKPSLAQTMERIKHTIAHLYGLINNAGMFNQTPLEQQRVEEWDKVIALNLTAPYLLSQAFSPLLSLAKGHIVNIASTRALMSEAGTEAYSASKGGIKALTHALAISLSGCVSVNSISPGWINTDENYLPSAQDNAWHPSGRVGTPNDIAEMVLFLLRQKEGFITGSDFVIDGGVSKKMVYM